MVKITFLGWANFIVEGKEKTICFDPFFESEKKADVILISHSHPDHCNLEVIEKMKKENTIILANEETAKNIPGVEIIKIGEQKEIDGIKAEEVYAYNLNIPNHQKGKDLGFVVEMEGKRIYHTGDTDFIPEMKEIKNIDLALLPVGGTYTMDVSQAIEAVKTIQPEVVIPMHYGKIEVEFQGEIHKIELPANLEEFKKRIEEETDTKVVILSKNEEYVLE